MTVEQQLQTILDAATAALDAANTALAAKGATPVNSISELAAQIDSISGGGADVSGVTAKASDVREDEVFYGANGKETGTIRVYGKPGQQIGTNNVRVSQGKDLFGYDVIWFETTQRSTVIYPEGIKPYMTAKIEKFGDATAADVAEGKTFTSSAGLTAKGTVFQLASGGYKQIDIRPQQNSAGGELQFFTYTFDRDILLRKGAVLFPFAKLADFGNATAADVRQGKTFTSAAGYLAKGTASF